MYEVDTYLILNFKSCWQLTAGVTFLVSFTPHKRQLLAFCICAHECIAASKGGHRSSADRNRTVGQFSLSPT